MDLEAVVARLLATGAAADDDPARLAVALAATGPLAAADADLMRPPAVQGPSAGPQPVIWTVPWRDPTPWLDRVGETAAVAVEWCRDGRAVPSRTCSLPPQCGRTTTTSRPGQARATGSETSRSPECGAGSRGSCGSAVGRVGHRGCSYW